MFELMRNLHNGQPLLFGGSVFDELAERTRPSTTRSAAAAAAPADVDETADAIRVLMDLPGLDGDKITINFKVDTLTIEAERAAPKVAGEKSLLRERGFGKIKRTFTVNVPVDSERVQAAYEHGVLTVTLPKREEAKPHKITVEVKK